MSRLFRPLRLSFLTSSRVFPLSSALIILTGLFAIAHADNHLQTDWSGGPLAQTPVFEWSDTFRSAVITSWRSVPGQIAISSVPINPTGGAIVQPSPACRSVASGDLDGDGDVDLMSALFGEVHWYENSGDGVNWIEHILDEDFYGGRGITAGDIDGDGDLDIVASAFYGDITENGRYVWYENVYGNASEWNKGFIAGYLWGTEMAAVIDMDGDDDLDVYGCSSLTYVGNFNDDIYWFDNVNGDGSVWVQRTVDDDYDDAIDAEAADIDRDGDIDIVCTSYATEDINWWENVDGSGTTWVKHLIAFNTLNDNTVAVADIDDDGDIDAVATGYHSGHVALYRNMDGYGGSWSGSVVGITGGNGRDVEIADLDGDGRLDVLTASTNAIRWFRNLGGTSFSTFLVTYPERTGELAIGADINGDGALEVVYTVEGYYYGDIAGLFRRSITEFRPGGELESAVLDAQESQVWTTIDWTATVPPGTALAFRVRSSNDPDDLGAWSDEITSPGSLSGILDPNTRYVQYKAALSTTDPHASPIVRDVTLRATGSQSVPSSAPGVSDLVSLQAPWPNPTAGRSTTRFVLRNSGLTRMDILDAQGRRVASPLFGVMTAGTHEVGLPELPRGVYLIRLCSRGESVARKLVVR